VGSAKFGVVIASSQEKIVFHAQSPKKPSSLHDLADSQADNGVRGFALDHLPCEQDFS
jgi:hypothetical protein